MLKSVSETQRSPQHLPRVVAFAEIHQAAACSLGPEIPLDPAHAVRQESIVRGVLHRDLANPAYLPACNERLEASAGVQTSENVDQNLKW